MANLISALKSGALKPEVKDETKGVTIAMEAFEKADMVYLGIPKTLVLAAMRENERSVYLYARTAQDTGVKFDFTDDETGRVYRIPVKPIGVNIMLDYKRHEIVHPKSLQLAEEKA